MFVYVYVAVCAVSLVMLHVLCCIIVACHTDLTPEVVDFKNIGSGQCLLNITIIE